MVSFVRARFLQASAGKESHVVHRLLVAFLFFSLARGGTRLGLEGARPRGWRDDDEPRGPSGGMVSSMSPYVGLTGHCVEEIYDTEKLREQRSEGKLL